MGPQASPGLHFPCMETKGTSGACLGRNRWVPQPLHPPHSLGHGGRGVAREHGPLSPGAASLQRAALASESLAKAHSQDLPVPQVGLKQQTFTVPPPPPRPGGRSLRRRSGQGRAPWSLPPHVWMAAVLSLGPHRVSPLCVCVLMSQDPPR